MNKKFILFAIFIIISSVLAGCKSDEQSASSNNQLINVSYDPTRELYAAYNAAFIKHWQEKTGQAVTITQSHGGSGAQARSVIEGNDADVVTLALEYDITAIEKTGLIKKDWLSSFPHDSSPYTSTIVFLVRKGNPKNIKDWNDLIRPDISIITPNPKTSGGARWNYLAAWAYANNAYQGNEEQMKKYMKKLFNNVLVLDSGARGATTTFVENGQGDVLLAWENEAYLSLKEHPDEFQIVSPSISILAQPSVAVVDKIADEHGTRKLAEEYLNYLYSPEAQKIAADNFYRPTDENILKQYANTFDLNIKLVTINDPLFGGWNKVQETHFKDGGIFDQIYQKK
ncbi:sulfate ABC transporter substrate-binding protein [Pectinatus frisingensis]|jgi:sulfate transport system substrate-binding protein|uniref:sulfate ABC transporter substrate-binding protein n=1 Tax=Pectinatus frisingensis TaxID=865 RepID=UPI0018C6696A|nr:sulfate ABC transporter substrate-binding protein [Pectinatus frisingensis]